MNNEAELVNLVQNVGTILLVAGLLLLVIIIPVLIAEWKLFKKAGKKGWEAIVPFYSTWVLIEVAGLNWWYFLISIGLSLASNFVGSGLTIILSLASYYINFIIYYNLAKKTKQNLILYGILGIFVPFIAMLILGFSKNITYDNNIEVSPNGVL